MAKLTAFEAKTRFGEVLDRVIAGEEITITRHDKAVARIVPEGRPNLGQIRRAVEGLENLQREIAAKGRSSLSWAEFKELVEEGRK